MEDKCMFRGKPFSEWQRAPSVARCPCVIARLTSLKFKRAAQQLHDTYQLLASCIMACVTAICIPSVTSCSAAITSFSVSDFIPNLTQLSSLRLLLTRAATDRSPRLFKGPEAHALCKWFLHMRCMYWSLRCMLGSEQTRWWAGASRRSPYGRRADSLLEVCHG